MYHNTCEPIQVEIGQDTSHRPVTLDFFDPAIPNTNSLIFGAPAEGKSVLTKNIAGHMARKGTRTVIVSSCPEYSGICQDSNGKYHTLGNDVCVNPLDISLEYAALHENPIQAKGEYLISLFSLLDPQIAFSAMYETQTAVAEVYKRSGFLPDGSLSLDASDPPGGTRRMPTLADFSAVLSQMASDDAASYPFAGLLLSIITPLTESPAFCGQTNIRLDPSMTVIDCSRVPAPHSPCRHSGRRELRLRGRGGRPAAQHRDHPG